MSSCSSRQWISLGGWCGPSLILSKLGRTSHASHMPYDMVRCTLDGIAEFTKVGFGLDGANFFPRPNEHGVFVPDPVSIWLLFRGWHTAFTHYDLNRPLVRDLFVERMRRWAALFDSSGGERRQVIFLRTSISEDPLAEFRFVPALQRIFDEASDFKLDHRFVLVHHHHHHRPQQSHSKSETKPVCFIDDDKRAVLWSLAHDPGVDASASLFDKSEAGYRKIVETCENDDWWLRAQQQQQQQQRVFEGRDRAILLQSLNNKKKVDDDALLLSLSSPSRLLSHVEGIPTFRGTCSGFGSTESHALGGVCISCGDNTGHALNSPTLFDSGRPWTPDEEGEIADLVVQHQLEGAAADVVQKVEEGANKLNRGANETLLKMKELGPNLIGAAF